MFGIDASEDENEQADSMSGKVVKDLNQIYYNPAQKQDNCDNISYDSGSSETTKSCKSFEMSAGLSKTLCIFTLIPLSTHIHFYRSNLNSKVIKSYLTFPIQERSNYLSRR